MSSLRVNRITNFNDNGAVTISKGISIPNNGTVVGNIVVSGVTTASAFVGDGSGLFFPGQLTASRAVAITLITS